MRGRRLTLLAALAISASAASAQSSSVVTDSAKRTARWEEDLRTLVAQLERRHPAPHHQISKRAFTESAEQLRVRIPSATDATLTIAMLRLVASLGDSHTAVAANFQSLGFHRLPIASYWFDDGVYIRDADTSIVGLIGARITAVNGHPMDTVTARLSRFIAYDNESQLKYALPNQLVVAEILHAADLSTRVDSVALHVIDRAGRTRQLVVPTLPFTTAVSWGLPSLISGDSLPPFRRNINRAYWVEHLARDSAIYVAYNRASNDPADPIDAFADRVAHLARAHGVTRVIVDFRRNQGGNSSVFNALQRRLVALRSERPTVQLIGIIGRQTFSSGLWNALAFQRRVGATMYGEPTGGKPNHFGEVRQFTLPHSRLVVHHSTKRWRLLKDEDPPSLTPHVSVPNRAAEYFALRDVVLEQILGSNPR